MNPEKYYREIQLICPSCGCAQFESESVNDSEVYTCSSCNRTMSKDELERENLENINVHIDEIKKDVIQDAAKEIEAMLKKAFAGNKNIKFR